MENPNNIASDQDNFNKWEISDCQKSDSGESRLSSHGSIQDDIEYQENANYDNNNYNNKNKDTQEANPVIFENFKLDSDSNVAFGSKTLLQENIAAPVTNKMILDKKDLHNLEKSKLACLVRKKYTLLMKESIKYKSGQENKKCCSFKNVNKTIILKLLGSLFQSIISVIATLVYVVTTYYPDYSLIDEVSETDKFNMTVLRWSEITVSILITLDYIYNLILSKKKCKFLFSFLNVLDFVIILSTILSFIYHPIQDITFIRIFRIVRMLRVFRFYKILRSAKNKETANTTDITSRLVGAIFTVIAVVFAFTGIVHFLHNNFNNYFKISVPSLMTTTCLSGKSFKQANADFVREGLNLTLQCEPGDPLIRQQGKITFDLIFYYMVITMATVGYGDIYPNSSGMRLVIGIFVIISIITISKETSELNDLIKTNMEYKYPYKSSKNEKHCVLSGFFNNSTLTKFLSEFYNNNNTSLENTKIIIIHSDYPDKEIQSILLNPKYEDCLHYLMGDIFCEKTLEMAQLKTAISIILLSDQSHPDSVKNDQFLILACKAMSQFSQAPLYVQFNYSQSLLHNWADWDMACSSQQLKNSIIVKNGFISGFSTLIMNLSCSSSILYHSAIKKLPWMLEYIYGASQEIFVIPIDHEFINTKLKELVENAYFYCGSLVIGVKRKVYYERDKEIFYYIYLLNPIDCSLKEEDELIVISTDLESAKSIFKLDSNKEIRVFENITEENFESFASIIRDENAGIKYGNVETEEDFNVLNRNSNKLTLNSGLGFKKLMTIKSKSKSITPKIFQKRQLFKIWEANSHEFELELKNHYLIFCKEDQLLEFMNCYDQFYSSVIFFVTDQHPSPKWDTIRRSFKNLVFIESSYSDHDDLLKLNLNKAKHVFILTYAVQNSNVNDSGILPLVKIIDESFPKCKYTLELLDDLNIRYLKNTTYNESDTKILKNHYKPKAAGTTDISTLPVRLWPKYASSHIFFTSSLESILAFSFHKEGLVDILNKLLGLKNSIKDKQIEENNFLSMYRYVGKNKILFGKIIKNFFRMDPPLIPIAVYRNKKDQDLSNDMSYVITNPKKDLQLNFFDKIICLGRPAKNVFNNFNEDEFNDEINGSFKHTSSDESNEPIKNKISLTNNKQSYDDIDSLNEIQLLQKIEKEIRNVKNFKAGSNIGNISKFNSLEVESKINTIKERNEETFKNSSEDSECNSSKEASDSSKDNKMYQELKNLKLKKISSSPSKMAVETENNKTEISIKNDRNKKNRSTHARFSKLSIANVEGLSIFK